MNSPDLYLEITLQNIWHLAGWIIGITISIASLVFAFWTFKASERRKKLIDWDEITKASIDIKGKIIKDGSADVFLAIDARSAIFAYKVEEVMPKSVPTLTGFCFSSSHIRDETQFDGYSKIEGGNWVYFIPENVRHYKDSKIVIFDDFAITGKTFSKLSMALENLGFESRNIKTASIACTTTAIRGNEAPNYYWTSMDVDEAILPWGKMSH